MKAKEFNNIEIVHIQEKHIMYGPIFPNYGDDLELLQCRNSEYFQVKPASIKTSSTPIIETPLFWCGSLQEHFGHFIAECISRILPFKELKIKGKLYALHPETKKVYDYDDYKMAVETGSILNEIGELKEQPNGKIKFVKAT